MEFTRRPNGMEDEYQKVLKKTKSLLYANGHTREEWNKMYRDLHYKEQELYEYIQFNVLELILEEQALRELDDHINDEKYWD